MQKLTKKFRAWDDKKKEMFQPQRILYDMDGDIFLVDREWEEIGSICILMQYTGWTDKTGQEIYEDDIILGHADGEARIVKDLRRLHFLIMDMQIKESDLEVVGNIHETSKMKEILDNKPKTDYEDYLI